MSPTDILSYAAGHYVGRSCSNICTVPISLIVSDSITVHMSRATYVFSVNLSRITLSALSSVAQSGSTYMIAIPAKQGGTGDSNQD